MVGKRDALEIRPFVAADTPAVLLLLHASLGWVPDSQYAAFFAWKHEENPFGASPGWVAWSGDTLIGFRTFLRWEFQSGARVVRAVRAVDTATHPSHQGRGVFSRLTLHGLEELRAQGVDFVFNTPNDRSRPGYLKMGWRLVGRLPVLVRPRSPRSLLRVARARAPAEKWSVPTGVGVGAAELLEDQAAVALLLRSQPTTSGLRTRRTPEFLAWRYSFAPLAYRAQLVGDRVCDGFALFRLRRRGAAVEAAICDVLVPGGDRRLAAALVDQVVSTTGADHGVRIGGPETPWARSVPLPGQGPTLAWRDLNETAMPELGSWRLVLGDVELF